VLEAVPIKLHLPRLSPELISAASFDMFPGRCVLRPVVRQAVHCSRVGWIGDEHDPMVNSMLQEGNFHLVIYCAHEFYLTVPVARGFPFLG